MENKMLEKMPDSMKKNLMERDVKVEMLKKKIKAKINWENG